MKLQDYLHLYLGCEIVYEGEISRLESIASSGLVGDENRDEDGEGWYHIDDIKPILRPLSDMTEAEAFELCEYYGSYGEMPGRRTYESYINRFGNMVISWGSSLKEKWVPIKCEVWNPEQIRILLSKHFDLFGLIPAGLAIDKTKEVA